MIGRKRRTGGRARALAPEHRLYGSLLFALTVATGLSLLLFRPTKPSEPRSLRGFVTRPPLLDQPYIPGPPPAPSLGR